MKYTKKQVTEEAAKRLIPCDPYYCLDSGKCPFYHFRRFSKSKYNKLIEFKYETQIIDGVEHLVTVAGCFPQYPAPYLEWCSYLHEPLFIQDGIKQCGINEFYRKESELDDD